MLLPKPLMPLVGSPGRGSSGNSLKNCLIHAASQALQLLQSMHSSGWLHRDVKPANFVRTLDSDPADGGQWRIVDFGLAKPYISKEGEIIDAREGYNEFRGSTNYASIEAHQKKELGALPFILQLLCGIPGRYVSFSSGHETPSGAGSSQAGASSYAGWQCSSLHDQR